MRRLAVASVVAICGAGIGTQRQVSSSEQQVAVLRQVVEALAADSLGGRRAGTRGHERAAVYVTERLRRAGLQPQSGRAYDVPLVEAGDTGKSFVAVVDGPLGHYERLQNSVYRVGDEFLPLHGTTEIPFPVEAKLAARQVVFGGRIGSADVLPADSMRGKILVVHPPLRPNGEPDYQLWAHLKSLRAFSSADALFVASLDLMPRRARAIFEQPSVFLRDQFPRDLPPIVAVSPIMVSSLLLGDVDAMKPGQTGKIQVNLTVGGNPRRPSVPARNVAIRIAGSDPVLRDEVVILTAPLDHLGTMRGQSAGVDGQSASVDSIDNGADAATGAASLIAIAESFARQSVPLRRSLLFVWSVGSLHGTLGTKWFLDNSPFPRDRIVANINVDMIGRGGANDIPGGGSDYLQIAGANRLSTQLNSWVHDVNRTGNFNFRIDTTFDAPGHPARYHCNGDHWSFLRHGIPSVFITTGTHADYHTVDDEIEKIDFEKFSRVTEFIAALVTDLANRPARPAIDKPKPDPKAPCVQ